MRLIVVGNPDNRRVAQFRAAAVAAGLSEPQVIGWRQVLTGAPLPMAEGALVRIDSPGEDAEVDRLLRGAPAVAEPGEIVGGRDWYAGFGRALARIASSAGEQGAHLLADPDEIMVMFDKRACNARLAMAGVPVPAALAEPPTSWEHLRALLAEVGWNRVFVKPCHGSSASGVIALQFGAALSRPEAAAGSAALSTGSAALSAGPVGRLAATTSVRQVGDRLFNSLRIRTYRDESQIAEIVDRLAPDGLHVERWFPKAGMDGAAVDLRVLTISGRPSHVVVRRSTSPMTNLHLGGGRGDLAALRAAAGPLYDQGLAACAAAARCFPGSHQVGVDLMLGSGWRGIAVAEVNAFGDLLPGLLVDGRDTYAAQIHDLLTRTCGTSIGPLDRTSP